MNDETILARARAAGLAVDWVDVMGQQQRVRPDSLRRLLEALPDPYEHRGLPPLLTTDLEACTELAGLGLSRDTSAELALEDGTVLPFVLQADKPSVPPISLPGYHRLRFGDREFVLAVAPRRCVTLRDIGGGQRMWGVAAQVYGLRRPGDGGIGDAGAVRQLAEVAARQGADAVALSPVHCLFAADPGRCAPYSPSSRVFLNPLYADPSATFSEARIAAHRPQGVEVLEGQKLIDWRAAGAAKFSLLRGLFEDFLAHDLVPGSELARDFERFVREGGQALLEHALFEALHAERPCAWTDWPAGWRQPSDHTAVRYHLFLQWLTDRSFAAAHQAARSAGMRIGLISDLAIGMDCAGSHAWARQSDLLLDLSIGAPPDGFNPRGQDWGLTGFSPGSLIACGFEPFLATVRAALRHAGGVRVDHVMGLMRLWLIPRGAAPVEGAYLNYPLDDLLRLLALESHRHGAVVIGEDLGTLPPGFRERLQGVGIAGIDVLWFERNGLGFKQPSHWRSEAVATTTTHDLPTVAGWWTGEDLRTRRALGLATPGDEEEREKDRDRLWRAFVESGTAHPPRPTDDEPEAVVDGALAYGAQSPSPLMLAPIEDLLGLVEQPNLPGTIDEHPNWRRRLSAPVSELFATSNVERRVKLIGGCRR